MTQRSSSSGEQFSVTGSESRFSTDPGATQPFNTSSGTGGMSGQGSTQDMMGQAKHTASNVADQAKEQAGQLADQARTQVTSRISTQKERAAEGLGGVAQALRQTSQQLRDQDQSGITNYVEQAADQVERLSNYLRQHEVRDLVSDVERFARQQPTLFISGAFTLGLLAARFLKSSSPEDRGSYLQNRYTSSRMSDSGTYGSSGYDRGYSGGAGYGSVGYDRDYSGGASTTGAGDIYSGTSRGTTTPSSTGYSSTTTTPSTADYGSSPTTRGTGLVGENTSDTSSNINSSQAGPLGTTDSAATTSSRYGTAESSRERGGREEL